MEYMRGIGNKFFDLAVVDPPYGISAERNIMNETVGKLRRFSGYRKNRLSSGGGKLKNINLHIMNTNFDFELPDDDYFAELFRISKNQIIWGGNYFPLPPTRCILCWDKMQAFNTFSQIEIAWTSFDSPAKLFRYATNCQAPDKSKKIHPTQKPVALYSWLLEKYAKPGDRIFDSHLGSGSSRIAAYGLGFDFYATEIDKSFFDSQEIRFREKCLKTFDRGDGKTAVQQSLF
jgi:site-specific DNA-methyltransferase (adenine-specific)